MPAIRNVIVCSFTAAFLAAAPAAFAQRAVQSPLTVQVIRTKTDSSSQQIGLRLTVRNMSQKPVEVRVEALFMAEPAYGGGKEFIFCERKTSRTFTPGEQHEFNTESDEGANRSYEINGSYYYYSSLKIKGYITRVFADGILVNVSGSAPSLQKIGWEDKELGKIGYSGAPAKETPVVVARSTPPSEPAVSPSPEPAEPETPRKQPRAVMPRDEDDLPVTRSTPPTVSPATPVVSPVTVPTPQPVAPAAPSAPWDEAVYTSTAKRYNAAVEAYQGFLQKRGTQEQLKKIEDELHECASAFEKMEAGAPASHNIGALIARCRQTIFAVHSTRRVE